MNHSAPRLRTALEFLLYAVLTAVMLHATWLTWPDAFIDFSRELYLPWRVSCGDVLYRDLAYYFGPVSVYTNAALFALLGRPSIHALFVLNFVFWCATLLALRAILRRIASPLVATIAVSSFILLFSFSRYTGVGNDNFLAPYSHEITRGFLFSLLALLSLDSAFRRLPALPSPHPSQFIIPGILYALVLFTKPELALASTTALALLFALHALRNHFHLLRPVLAFSIASFATMALVVVPVASAMGSLSRACHDSLFRIYLDCFNTDLTSLPYFKSVLGTDHLLANTLRLGRGILLASLPFFLARLFFPRLSSRPLRLVVIILLSVLAAAIGWLAFFPLNAALPLAPCIILFRAPLEYWRLVHFGKAAGSSPAPPLAVAFALFALLLASKVFLNCGIGHYGFVLALPAFCCAIALALPPDAALPRMLPAAMLFAGFLSCALHLQTSAIRSWGVSHPVYDASFLTYPVYACAFNEALDWLRTNTPPGSTLAVCPEGAILNVLADRPNPTPYCSLELPGYRRYDAASLLSAYSNNPPDTLILVQTAPPCFGIDYAQDLMSFLDPLYTPAVAIHPPNSPSAPRPFLLIARKN